MSWSIDLVDPVTKETLTTEEKHHMHGAIVAVGGSNELSTNITYNYGKLICPKFNESLRELNLEELDDESYAEYLRGKTAAETLEILKKTIDKLGDDVDEDDYWHATEGNAKRALCILLAFAQMRPDGIWEVF